MRNCLMRSERPLRLLTEEQSRANFTGNDWRHASVIGTRKTPVDHLRKIEFTGYKTLYIVRLDNFLAVDGLKQVTKPNK
jgi:hypothetical protein